MDRTDSLLTRIGHLSVADLWHADDPLALFDDLGYTVHWHRTPTHAGVAALDLLLTDPDGCWWALRLGGDHHSDETGESWADRSHRLLLLYRALSDPGAGPCPSLGDLVQALATPRRGTFEAEAGDHWATGVLLAAALDLLPETDRPGHHTLIALRHPHLLADVDALRHWMHNTADPDWHARSLACLTSAVTRLWPTMRLAPNLPDEDLAGHLLAYPRDQWDAAAATVLSKAAAQEGSLTYWALVAQWEEDGPDGVRVTRPRR